MKLTDFDFHLPQELIAQTPIENRSESRLLVVNTQTGSFKHEHFSDIINYLRPTDVLVRNNTKVIPARLFGTKLQTNAHVELLILEIKENECKCLVGNAKVVKLGTLISFGQGELVAECIEVLDQGLRRFRMHFEGIFLEVLQQLGEVPLPPYIKAKLSDPDRYQTVYAKVDGSAAAPTAGLHFTEELNKRIVDRGYHLARRFGDFQAGGQGKYP